MNNNILIQSELDNAFLKNNLEKNHLNTGASVNFFDNKNYNKPTIIFIPMIKEVNLVYVPLIKHFNNRYRTILHEPNLSTKRILNLEARAKEIINLIDSLKIKKCHFIAWSDTCSTAYVLGKKYPNRCKSITFIGIADKYILPQPYQFLVKALYHFPLEELFPSKVSAFLLSKCLGGNHINYKWLYSRSKSIPGFTKLLKYSIIPNLIEHTPLKNEMSVVCQIICGDKDFLASPSSSEKMFKLLLNCKRLDILLDSEHFFVYTNYKDVANCIDTFFSTLDKTF